MNLISWITTYFKNHKWNKMLEQLEYQIKLNAGSDVRLQKRFKEISSQRFYISEEQITNATSKHLHHYYTQDLPYALNPLLDIYFKAVPNERNIDPRYENIKALF